MIVGVSERESRARSARISCTHTCTVSHQNYPPASKPLSTGTPSVRPHISHSRSSLCTILSKSIYDALQQFLSLPSPQKNPVPSLVILSHEFPWYSLIGRPPSRSPIQCRLSFLVLGLVLAIHTNCHLSVTKVFLQSFPSWQTASSLPPLLAAPTSKNSASCALTSFPPPPVRLPLLVLHFK